MKYFLTFLMFAQFVRSNAQVEFTVAYPDSNVSYATLKHLIDKEGNLYILSNAFFFDGISGGNLDNPYNYGSIICKSSQDGAIKWQKLYRTYEDSILYWSILKNFEISASPTKQFFLNSQQNIVLPYGIYKEFSLTLTRRNGVLVLDRQNGKQISDSVFLDTCCSEYYAQKCDFRNDTLSNFYQVNNGQYPLPLYFEKRLVSSGRLLENQLVDTSWIGDPASLIIDPYKKEFLLQRWWKHRAFDVYDEHFILNRTINYCDTNIFHYITPVTTQVNDDYYAIHYRAVYKAYGLDSEDAFLAIIDKKGNIISNQKSENYTGFYWANDNTLWGVETTNWNDSIAHPIVVDQLDKHQNIIRKLHIGYPYCVGADISIFNSSELIVTGTYGLSNKAFYPNLRPTQLYVYRQKIRDIPTITPQNRCNDIVVSPNPTDDMVNIWLPIVDSSRNYRISVTNILGQTVATSAITNNNTMLDFSQYASGIYIIKIADRVKTKVCVSKVLRE